MGNFLKLSFWFDVYPLPFEGLFLWLALGLSLLAAVLGILAISLRKWFALNKIKREIWSRFSHLSLTFGLVSLVLIFFKQQRAPYLGMRFWSGLLLLTCLVWFFFILKYIFIKAPKIREEKKKLEELRKYLP